MLDRAASILGDDIYISKKHKEYIKFHLKEKKLINRVILKIIQMETAKNILDNDKRR